MALKTLKPRLSPMPNKTIGGDTHQPKSRWGNGRGGRPWRRIREQVFIRDKYTCQDCGRIGGQLECDHKVPVSQGGTDDMDNLQTLCADCHHPKTKAEAKMAGGG